MIISSIIIIIITMRSKIRIALLQKTLPSQKSRILISKCQGSLQKGPLVISYESLPWVYVGRKIELNEQ